MTISVLVVDDSKLARMAVIAAIGRVRPDWVVVEATNAEEARQTVGGADVALIDVNMPGVSGLCLARALRAERPDLPMAIVTANIQDEVLRQARALDAGFVAKPLTDEALEGFLAGAALRLRQCKP